MLVKRLPSILPDMTPEEALETTKIHSVAGALPGGRGLLRSRPFRAPHHNISAPGLAGGGSIPRPGEVSLAHHGVLFWTSSGIFPSGYGGASPASGGWPGHDLPRQRLVVLPLLLHAGGRHESLPLRILRPSHPLLRVLPRRCASISRVSGPLLDRIDLHIEVPPVEYGQLAAREKGETSAAIRERVNAARRRQRERFAGTGIACNAQIPPGKLGGYCPLSPGSAGPDENAFDRLGLSARSYDRLLKVSRTIADLEGQTVLRPSMWPKRYSIGGWIENIGKRRLTILSRNRVPPHGKRP